MKIFSNENPKNRSLRNIKISNFLYGLVVGEALIFGIAYTLVSSWF